MPKQITLDDIKNFNIRDWYGYCGCAREILTHLNHEKDLPFALKTHPQSLVQISFDGKNTLIESPSPTSDYSVAFVQENERADFYAIKRGKKSPVMDSMLIYRIAKTVIQRIPNQTNRVDQLPEGLLEPIGTHQLDILWSEDGLKSALLINGRFHAVYDFESLTGFCRSTGCQVMNYGFKTCHKWSDSAMNYFTAQPQEQHSSSPSSLARPTASDLRDLFLKNYFKPTLKAHGYRANGLDFFKERNEVFTMISFQNSAYSTQCQRRFSIHFGLVKKSEILDLDPKKLTFHNIGRDSHFGIDTFLPKNRTENPYRDGHYYLIERDDDLSDFTQEFKTDFEEHILPALERL